MCHTCKDILEIMNIQGDAIVTDQLERDSTCKVVFFISVHVEVTPLPLTWNLLYFSDLV